MYGGFGGFIFGGFMFFGMRFFGFLFNMLGLLSY